MIDVPLSRVAFAAAFFGSRIEMDSSNHRQRIQTQPQGERKEDGAMIA